MFKIRETIVLNAQEKFNSKKKKKNIDKPTKQLESNNNFNEK